ncbi:MAG TPA: heavy metal translocating P-type ATPase, partial [Gemmatimonadaceae bacterium]|nr:heavy metal translocating P-type ATPase [Gemmatimonadaceae bacterium]
MYRIALLGALILLGAPLVWRTARGVARGQFATDVVASLAIITAVAMDQPFAGLVIVAMQRGGEFLERYAEGRASNAVRELEREAPRVVHRLDASGDITDLPTEQANIGDLLLVRPGEMIPCDGTVVDGSSHLDEARITGEPVPRFVETGDTVQSGAMNIESAVRVRVTAIAAESLYAKVVELVRTAQANKAPLQRLADRYAVWFTPLTIVVSGGAWLISGDPLRALAVLVVATPCPLIIATPVAIIGGINRAARRQIIVRTGGALEQVGGVTAAVFDKTGTITVGRPDVSRVMAAAPFNEMQVLADAAAVEEQSGHLLARNVVAAAARRGAVRKIATRVVESPGAGVTGTVCGHRVSVGSLPFIAETQSEAVPGLDALRSPEARLAAFVAVDGHAAGAIEFADRLRDGLPLFLSRLGKLDVGRIVLLSGDHDAYVRSVADSVGISEAHGNLLPAQKLEFVRALMAAGERVM